MSLNSGALVTQIALYLKRPDLSSMIPSFVQMGENELNRRLPILQREVAYETFGTLASGDSSVEIAPSGSTVIDLLEILRLWRYATPTDVNSRRVRIEYRSPEQIAGSHFNTFDGGQSSGGSTGAPRYFTNQGAGLPPVSGERCIVFDRVADQSYIIGAWVRYPFYLAGTFTNWLASYHEEAYLYAALVQAEPFLKNDKRIIVWRSMLEAVIQQIKEADTRARNLQDARLIPDISSHLPARPFFNINEG